MTIDDKDGEKAVERKTDGAWSASESGDVTVAETKAAYPPTFKLTKRQKDLRVPLIRRRAFDQKEIELTDRPDTATKKVILEAFTQRVCDAERNALRRLSKRIRHAFKPLIPGRAKACYYFHPQLMIKHPGFLYTTADGEVSVWVPLDLPIFVEKIDEMAVLREIYDGDLSAFDKLAKDYDRAKKKRDLEIRRITSILNEVRDGRHVSYVDFVRDHPLYFDAMYRIITGRDLLEGVQTE